VIGFEGLKVWCGLYGQWLQRRENVLKIHPQTIPSAAAYRKPERAGLGRCGFAHDSCRECRMPDEFIVLESFDSAE
jgi:hypothetical protein